MNLINNRKWIFLLCSERGGSNFITALMNGHSAISGPATKHLFNPVARNYFRYLPFDNQSWEDFLEALNQLFNADFSFWESILSIDILRKEVTQGNIGHLFSTIYDKEARGKPVSFVKEIKVYEFLPFLMAWFPEAHYVHLIRDPRDMALSWKKSKSHQGGVVAAARQWKLDQQKYGMFSCLPGIQSKTRTLSYESLVACPEVALSPVLKDWGYSWEPAMLDFYRQSLVQKNAVTQPAWENLSQPVLSGNTRKYQIELSDMEIKMIERVCYFEMLQWGYAPQYDLESLKTTTESEIESFDIQERMVLPYSPSPGILENMAAKSVFYNYFKDENGKTPAV